MTLRYSLSHILLVVTIVALICGWWLDHRGLTKDKENMAMVLISCGNELTGINQAMESIKGDKGLSQNNKDLIDRLVESNDIDSDRMFRAVEWIYKK
jgi:hypothetical protein